MSDNTFSFGWRVLVAKTGEPNLWEEVLAIENIDVLRACVRLAGVKMEKPLDGYSVLELKVNLWEAYYKQRNGAY